MKAHEESLVGPGDSVCSPAVNYSNATTWHATLPLPCSTDQHRLRASCAGCTDYRVLLHMLVDLGLDADDEQCLQSGDYYTNTSLLATISQFQALVESAARARTFLRRTLYGDRIPEGASPSVGTTTEQTQIAFPKEQVWVQIVDRDDEHPQLRVSIVDEFFNLSDPAWKKMRARVSAGKLFPKFSNLQFANSETREQPQQLPEGTQPRHGRETLSWSCDH